MTTLAIIAVMAIAQADSVRTPDEQRLFVEHYPVASQMLESAHTIPGLASGYVPQGIAAIPDRSIVVISCYHDSGDGASVLTFVDGETGRLIRTLGLEHDGNPVTGHVGGVTACRGWLWTAFEGTLHRFRIPDDDELEELSVLEVDSQYAVGSNATCLSSSDDTIWVGDFAYGLSYTTPAHRRHSGKRAWVAAYTVGASGDLTARRRYEVEGRLVLRPDQVVFVRQKLQGFAVCDDVIALSTSYGANDSLLAFYESPLDGESFQVSLPEGNETDGYIVDSRNHLHTVELPAGSEDLEWNGDQLLLPFESGANRLRSRWRFFGAHIEDRFYRLRPETEFAGKGVSRQVRVRADRENWSEAGLLIRAGQSLRIEARGEITLQKNDLSQYPHADANGQRGGLRSYQGVRAPNGCLLVKIGETVYQAGTDVTLTAESSGLLRLGILENGRFSNNDGQFDVEITVLSDQPG